MYRRWVLAGTLGVISMGGCLSGDDEIEGFERGELDVIVDGDPVDLSADRFQSEHAEDSLAFHFHEFDDYWYMEGAERVTFAEAIDYIPNFAYAYESDHVVTIGGTTYDADEQGTEITFVRNGERVDPRTERLYDRDVLRLEIETDA